MKKMFRRVLAIFLSLALLAAVSVTSFAAGQTVDTPDPPSYIPFAIGQKLPSAGFTGNAYLKNLITKDKIYNFPTTNVVTFEPGARSNWHVHGGMIIMATGGLGYYQEEGKPALVLRKGDIVEIPEGTRHWHGAAPNHWFQQIVIYDTDYVPTDTRPSTPVTDEQYRTMQKQEARPRTTKPSPVMFDMADTAMESPNFNGPAYVSGLVSQPNAANAAPMANVVFGDSVINNWHEHDGGQILLCTDGVGYHQIAGQEVQVMHPGDIAFCPPGVRHWHGAAPGATFAHVAIETNPSKPGVHWYDRISDSDYNIIVLQSFFKGQLRAD